MMAMYPTSTQQPAAICALKSPADAIFILEAVRVGLVPRVTRRLTGHERGMIRPGTIWVWEEEETNMQRWTDGRRWGASRVGGGGFLVYTESSEPASPSSSNPPAPREHLVKQTYSTRIIKEGKVHKYHVVAYSSKSNPQGDSHAPLPLPHQLPLLAGLQVANGVWPEWDRREPETTRQVFGSLPGSSKHQYMPTPYPPERPNPPPPQGQTQSQGQGQNQAQYTSHSSVRPIPQNPLHSASQSDRYHPYRARPSSSLPSPTHLNYYDERSLPSSIPLPSQSYMNGTANIHPSNGSANGIQHQPAHSPVYRDAYRRDEWSSPIDTKPPFAPHGASNNTQVNANGIGPPFHHPSYGYSYAPPSYQNQNQNQHPTHAHNHHPTTSPMSNSDSGQHFHNTAQDSFAAMSPSIGSDTSPRQTNPSPDTEARASGLTLPPLRLAIDGYNR